MTSRTKFNKLKEIFAILHGPKGCLWDKKQTHDSLIPYLKEESKEFISAVKNGNYHHMQEELGDILLQVMFHSQLASKQGRFDIEDVIEGLIKKLKRRHPHVFGKVKVKSAKQIIANWHKIKKMEKTHRKITLR
jgi:tetrapyrrole methylase family protein/MazG family protein